MPTFVSLSLAFIALLATIYGIAYQYLTTRHQERMALIEAGLDPTAFNRSNRFATFLLMLGVVIIGLAFAMAAGTLIEIISGYSYSEFPQIYLVVFPFFVGLSLLLCSFISKRAAKKQNKP